MEYYLKNLKKKKLPQDKARYKHKFHSFSPHAEGLHVIIDVVRINIRNVIGKVFLLLLFHCEIYLLQLHDLIKI
jgi:hypothetical protein